jgi:hypothetical protein
VHNGCAVSCSEESARTVKPSPKRQKSESGTTPYPRRASASAPPKGRKEGGQRRATRDQGGSERGRKQLCTSSKHTFTSGHGRISNRSPNQKDIAGKKRALSSTNRAGTSGQEAERIQKPRHAKAAFIRRIQIMQLFLAGDHFSAPQRQYRAEFTQDG